MKLIFEIYLETASMLMDVCLNGIEPFHKGHSTLLKVRLLHARVRHHLQKKRNYYYDNNNNSKGSEEEWDSDAWGCPVNQEDMAITAMMFTQVFCKSKFYYYNNNIIIIIMLLLFIIIYFSCSFGKNGNQDDNGREGLYPAHVEIWS